MEKQKNSKTYLFESMPVAKAVLTLVIPTVISQLINVIYNVADTFFIARVQDPVQVAAVSLCIPLFMVMTGLANLFGIGGASYISRCLGRGDKERAAQCSAFSIWSAFGIALMYSVIMLVFRRKILFSIGANGATIAYCERYVLFTIVLGAVPTVLNNMTAHLVRSEGYSSQASFGMILGGVLNIILDPIFISVLGMGTAGAALATLLSNTAALIYFIVLMISKRDSLTITLSPLKYTLKHGLPGDVILVGLPSFFMNIMGVFSNIVFNRLMSSYCNEAIAGIGIAKKVDMIAFALATGFSQGVLPLIGYNYSSEDIKRMRSVIKTTLAMSLSIAIAVACVLFFGSESIVNLFIREPVTVGYASVFQRIICIGGPCISVTMLVITIFQAIGEKKKPLFLSFLRKGVIDIPAILILNRIYGVSKAVYATPIADCLAMLTSLVLFIPVYRKLKKM